MLSKQMLRNTYNKYLGQWFSMRVYYPMHHSLGFLTHSTPYRVRSLQDWESMLLLMRFIEPVNSILENVKTELCMMFIPVTNHPGGGDRGIDGSEPYTCILLEMLWERRKKIRTRNNVCLLGFTFVYTKNSALSKGNKSLFWS